MNACTSSMYVYIYQTLEFSHTKIIVADPPFSMIFSKL